MKGQNPTLQSLLRSLLLRRTGKSYTHAVSMLYHGDISDERFNEYVTVLRFFQQSIASCFPFCTCNPDQSAVELVKCRVCQFICIDLWLRNSARAEGF